MGKFLGTVAADAHAPGGRDDVEDKLEGANDAFRAMEAGNVIRSVIA